MNDGAQAKNPNFITSETATTVVIPNYNGGQMLSDCLNSLKRGTRNCKIIVVDNASTDNSLACLSQNPEISLIRLPENQGFSAAVNEGIHAAQTPYVLLLNNDTVADTKFVQEMENAMERHPAAFSISAQMRSMQHHEILDSAGDYYCALGWAYGYGKGKAVSEKYQNERTVFSACAGAAIYRREIFEKIGLFDVRHFAYLEDVDLGYRARIAGYQNWYAPKAVVYHAGSAVSGSRYNEFKVDLSSRNSIYLIEKNMPFLQMVLNLPFLIPGFLIKYLFFARKGWGKTYRQGIGKGFHLYFKEGARQMHVPFQWKNLRNYVSIQLQLWANLFRRFL